MDCSDVKRDIPHFFGDELEGKELRDFVQHLKTCPDCMEETTIQYLATEGILRLEAGQTFELDRELQEKLEAAMRRERFHRRFKYILVGVELVSLLIILIVFIYVFF